MKGDNQNYLVFYMNPLLWKTALFELYLMGNPYFQGSTDGSKEWVEKVKYEISKNLNDPYNTLFEILKDTTGLFLIIIKCKNKIVIASDHIRSFPVFYGYNEERLFVTDNMEYYQRKFGRLDIDHSRIEEFLAVGNVLGNNTLFKNVYGIQAAEIVSIQEEEIKRDRYFTFKPAIKPTGYNKTDDFVKDFNDLFLFVFSRMVKQNPDVNNWIVPLSGGHDSRLVVNFLYRLGVRNVICFTYGTPGNVQAQISKRVSDALDYKWYFIEYSNEKWKELFDCGLFNEYVDYAFNGVSTVHIQDFLAIFELKAKGIIGEEDIILPGHTTVRRSVYGEEVRKLKNEYESVSYVYSRIVSMFDVNQKVPHVFDSLIQIYSELNATPDDFLAIADWQERRAKFITNSVRAYEFFGIRCLQPMWDMEMVNFWLKIPPSDCDEREPLYQAEKMGGLVKELISIPYADSKNNSLRDDFVKKIKNIMPSNLLIWLLRKTKRQVLLDEGLNQVYALSAGSVKDLLDPIEDFPKESIPYFREYLDRFPYQMDYNRLTTLFTVRLLLDNLKKEKGKYSINSKF